MVPSQTGNGGKFLQTDGSTTSWSNTVVVNSSSDAFRITQTGTGNAFVVEDSANPDSSPFVVNSSGSVGIGTTSIGSLLHVDGGQSSASEILRLQTTANFVHQTSIRQNGTVAAPTAVSPGNQLHVFTAYGFDGTASQISSRIFHEVDGTVSTGVVPGRITLYTANASGSVVERMRINNAGEVGIGAASTLGVTLFIAKNITGATTAYGIAHNATAQSDVTSTAYGISSRVNSAAASYTLSNLIAFQATAGSVGAGSTITNAYGFNVPSGFTQGSTLNIGFNGNLAANGSVNYNLYMGGTAPNYLNGNLGIGTTSPLYKLHTETDASNVIASIRNSTDVNPAHLYLSKRRGTAASPTVVVSGDNLGQITFYGYDGSALQQAALIQGSVDATPGTNDMPGRLTFWTTPDGSTGPSERMRIDSAGRVGIGTASPNQTLTVAGDMELRNNGVTAPTIHFTSQDGTTNVWQIDGQVSDSVNAALIVNNNGTERLRLTSTGGLIVGNGFTSATPNIGGIYATSGTGTNIAGANFGVYGGASTGNAAGGAVSIYTSPAGTSGSSTNTLTERLKVDSAGLITGSGTSLGAWTSYTPTLGGTGWAIGDGTISGVYCQIGKVVHFSANVTFGSTSTYGSAAATITLPITAKDTQRYAINARCGDASTGNVYQLAVYPSSTTVVVLRTIGTDGIGAQVISTAPFTWATTDTIRINGTYEAA